MDANGQKPPPPVLIWEEKREGGKRTERELNEESRKAGTDFETALFLLLSCLPAFLICPLRLPLRCAALGFAVALLPLVGAADEIRVPGGVVEMTLTESAPDAFRKLANEWTETSARAVSGYYGKFPVKKVRLQIKPAGGTGSGDGYSNGWKGATITISLGRASTRKDIRDDWQLPHEMVHLAFPNVADKHHWIEEGIATYVEPIARARAKIITPQEAWFGMVDGMPQGLPKAGDRGLDVTHTWGRTYWGGALFCLRADLEIRRRTGNRKGLEDALRGIPAAGGSIETAWELSRALDAGDRAAGVPVLSELYAEMKDKPVNVDLDEIWKKLGIQKRGETVVFDDHAPWVAIRRAIIPEG